MDPHGSGSSTPPSDPAGYSPEGHAYFYEEVRKALGLSRVVVLGHSFGATAALTFAALFPESIERCVAVAALCVGPESDAPSEWKAQVEAKTEALLLRHVRSPWYRAARPVMDHWTDLVMAATGQDEIDRLVATVLPFYCGQPDRLEAAGRLAEVSRILKPNLAAVKAWEGGMFQSVDLRPLLSRIKCPTLILTGELDYLCGPPQAKLIAAGIAQCRLEIIPNIGHMPSIETPALYRDAVVRFVQPKSALPSSSTASLKQSSK